MPIDAYPDAMSSFQDALTFRQGAEANELQLGMQKTLMKDQMVARAARMGAQSAEAWDQAFSELAQQYPEAQQYIGKWSPFAARELMSGIQAAPAKAMAAQPGGIAGPITSGIEAAAGPTFSGGAGGSNKSVQQPSGPQVDLSTLTPEQRTDEFRKLRLGMDALRKVRTVEDFDGAIDQLATEIPGVVQLKGMFNELNFAEGIQLLYTNLKGLHDQLAPLVMSQAAGAPIREAQPGYNVQYTEVGPVVATTPVGGGRPEFDIPEVRGTPRKEFLPAPPGGGGGGARAQPTLSPLSLSLMADQYLSGDKCVFQNLGRGVQGAANVVALRDAVYKRASEMGMTGAEIASSMAEFAGYTAGQRTIAQRGAAVSMAGEEARSMGDIVIQTSRLVDRSQFPDWNAVTNEFQARTGGTEVKDFTAALNSYINVYSRAIAPTGQGPTVSDKDHARELLQTAFAHGQIESVMRILNTEIDLALEAPETVKRKYREKFTGKKSPRAEDAPDKPPAKPKPSWVP